MQKEFVRGQVWRYQARPEDTASRALVVQVDDHPTLGGVVHFCLTNLSGLAADGSGGPGDIGFLPMKRAVAERCVLELESTIVELPHQLDFAEAYAEWLQAVQDGTGGAWGVPLQEVVSTVAHGRAS